MHLRHARLAQVAHQPLPRRKCDPTPKPDELALRYPTTLAELVSTHYLQALPVLPTGMRYNYNPANGVVKVVK